jgi:hypothetical protein
MKQLTQNLLTLLFVCLLAPAFAQDKDEEKSDTKNSRTNGLKRITPPRHWGVDEEAIEVNVERAVEHAMRSVEVALEKMEIHMSPMNLNLKQIDVPPVHVHIPHIAVEPVDVNIPPIHVNIPAIDLNINEHMHYLRDWDDDHHKNKSNKEDKEKTKGLKKIN